MLTLRRIFRHWGHALSAVVAAGLAGYFGFHLVTGERGLQTLNRLSAEEAGLTERLDTLRDDRRRLAHHVDLIRLDQGDPDLLEERVRTELGFARKGDLIIFRKR